MRALALAIVLALAGCVTPALVSEPEDRASVALAAITLANATQEGEALVWQGSVLEGPAGGSGLEMNMGMGKPECAPENCERTPFSIAGPARIQVAIQAEDTDHDYAAVAPPNPLAALDYLGDSTFFFALRVVDADGNEVGRTFDSVHQGSVSVIDAADGDYVVEVAAAAGTAAYRGAIRLLPDEPEPVGGLPDLAVAPPVHLRVTTPLARELAPALDPVTRGCGGDETAGARALRCLRYDTRILNLGPGDFEERLSTEAYTASLAQNDATWTQRIYHADGSVEDVPSGPAVFHAVHGHFHLNGLQKANIYAYDAEAKERGPLAAEGQKTGLCMVDGNIIDITSVVAIPNPRDNGCCYMAVFCPLDMTSREDFVQGISPGWLDTYPWWRADQYVDVSALADGIYELEVIINPDEVVRETSYLNNVASVLFELKGDEATILPR